jgi:hypothetical protein
MPYDVPTASQLKEKFPRFGAVEDARVTTSIVEAAGEVPTTWRESDYQPGILYLAAHLLMVDDVTISTVGGGTTTLSAADRLAQAKSITIGPLKASFETERDEGKTSKSGSSSGYGSTVYGQRFLELKARNTPTTFSLVRA